jgi:poly(3-hydroxybutyrate) depolymerase
MIRAVPLLLCVLALSASSCGSDSAASSGATTSSAGDNGSAGAAGSTPTAGASTGPASAADTNATGTAGSAAKGGSGANATTAGASGTATAGATAGRAAPGAAGAAAGAAAGSGASTAGMTAAAGSGGATAGATAGGDAAAMAGAPADAPRVPKFQKTRCIDPSKATPDKELNYQCDDVEVWVTLPSQCMQKACGLVFNIHGGGMTDHATMDQATNMIALGSAADYVVVHPHKNGGTWNVGSDKNTVFEIMQQAIQAFDVDKKRVHSTGYSQGGQISWALGCEHADVIASIAPAEEINRVSDCWKTSKLPARDLSILFAYGKQDSIGGGYAAAQMGAMQVVSSQMMMGPETVAGMESSKYWRQRWTGKSGNVLEFITQNYGSTGVGGILAGHCLPMSMGNTFVSCALPVDYDWGKEVIEFFKAHPAP